LFKSIKNYITLITIMTFHRAASSGPLAFVFVSFTWACAGDDASATASAGATASATGETSHSDAESATNSTSTGADTSADASETGDPSDSCSFLECDPSSGCQMSAGDGEARCSRCDIWSDDCPRGEKCAPWANNGGAEWNDTRCVPLAPQPKLLGEPCVVDDYPTSGADNCGADAICWKIDPETLTGVCAAKCVGWPDSPVCADPGAVCLIANDGVIAVCLATCDPIDPICADDELCSPHPAGFICLPAEPGDGLYGDDCTNLAQCAHGHTCVLPELIPGCFGAGCCTPFCQLEAPYATIPAPAPGCPAPELACVALYALDQAPAGLEEIGVCALD
jgi:hypothetical protein